MAAISSAYGAVPSAVYSAALPKVSSAIAVVSEAATPLPMSAYSSYSAVLPDKQVDKPTGGYDAPQPTPIASGVADATTCTGGAIVTETVKATVTVTVDGHAAISTGSY
jgi:hypothetical protein